MPHSIPLIKHWTDEMFNERAKAESDTGCLGSGLVARITFPICLQSTDERDGKQREVTNNAAENEDSESEYMLIKFPKGIESDEKIDARTTDKIQALILKLKRDSDLFHERNAMRFKEFKELTEASPPTRTEEGTSEPVLSPTQPFFRDPVFLHYIDSLTKMTKNVKIFAEDVPLFEDTNNVNTETEQQNEYADVIRDVEDDGDLGQFNEEGLEENEREDELNEREDEVVGGNKNGKEVVDDGDLGQFNKEGLEDNEREDEVVGGDDNGNEVDDGDLEGEHNQADEHDVGDDGNLGEENNEGDEQTVEEDVDDEKGVRVNDADDVQRMEINEDTVEDGTAVDKYPFF
ncbi:hypothetical protein RND81_04G056800 [Saponaria officinalis]|uniref:Uncharacterized protein n=1 Tax=Saponaria officinalis TaxID=3572 RepID=A0AAW1LD46_SAPOF